MAAQGQGDILDQIYKNLWLGEFLLWHPTLSSEFLNYTLNLELAAAVGMLRKKYNYNSKAETIF